MAERRVTAPRRFWKQPRLSCRNLHLIFSSFSSLSTYVSRSDPMYRHRQQILHNNHLGNARTIIKLSPRYHNPKTKRKQSKQGPHLARTPKLLQTIALGDSPPCAKTADRTTLLFRRAPRWPPRRATAATPLAVLGSASHLLRRDEGLALQDRCDALSTWLLAYERACRACYMRCCSTGSWYRRVSCPHVTFLPHFA